MFNNHCFDFQNSSPSMKMVRMKTLVTSLFLCHLLQTGKSLHSVTVDFSLFLTLTHPLNRCNIFHTNCFLILTVWLCVCSDIGDALKIFLKIVKARIDNEIPCLCQKNHCCTIQIIVIYEKNSFCNVKECLNGGKKRSSLQCTKPLLNIRFIE